MNNKESLRRTQRYLEGLEKAIAQPIPEASAKELDEILNDPEAEEQFQFDFFDYLVSQLSANLHYY